MVRRHGGKIADLRWTGDESGNGKAFSGVAAIRSDEGMTHHVDDGEISEVCD